MNSGKLLARDLFFTLPPAGFFLLLYEDRVND